MSGVLVTGVVAPLSPCWFVPFEQAAKQSKLIQAQAAVDLFPSSCTELYCIFFIYIYFIYRYIFIYCILYINVLLKL